MEFEFDPDKSATNKDKHGIDFDEAQALWKDEDRVEIPARTEDGVRFLVVGIVAGRHWSAIFTLRGRRIRLISVRRSRINEVTLYESERV